MIKIRKIGLIMTACMLAVGIGFGLDQNTITANAAGRSVSIQSCVIDGSDVVCELQTTSVPSSDDGKFYIFSDEVYEDGTSGEVVTSVSSGKKVTVSFPLNAGTEKSQLSKKFLVAVKRSGQMVQVSDEHYITNPEAVAAYTAERFNVGIKGILPDITMVAGGQLDDLGIQQIVYNMDLGEICSAEGAPDALAFSYNGETYYFDGDLISRYDATFLGLNRRGIQINVVLLNDGKSAYAQDLIHPLAVDGDCPGLALNVAEEAGTKHLKAIGAFLGQRYSGQLGCGQVDNWIIGNEVNARTSWWYTSSTSLDLNVNCYVKAFRILYNEIKGMNGSARIYNSIDQEWNRKSNPGSFLAKEYLDQFNYYMVREGNIDWGLTFHPYNSPLFDPYAWNGPEAWVKNNLSTPYITMQNLDLLVNYMHQDKFLSPTGEVRSISLAEVGYTSAFGTEAQEASIAYGYLKAASLPDIDSFILFRQTDDAHEMESNLALGLYDLNGNTKPSYEIYKKLGTDAEGEVKERASQIIGMDIDQMINEKIIWTRPGTGGA